MTRISSIFVALCMVLIAASVGALMLMYFHWVAWQAAAGAAGTLVVLGFGNIVINRSGRNAATGDQIADLSRGTTDLARQFSAMDRRIQAMEAKVDNAVEKVRSITDPLALELGDLSTLVKQLAESVAANEAASIRAKLTERTPALSSLPTEPNGDTAAMGGAGAPVSFRSKSSSDMADAIREAADANRIDLYLQPIVTLPQRKVRYYEATSRLRTADGESVLAADFVPHAEAAQLISKIDNQLVFKCIQVARRLLLKNCEVGVFCNISSATLTDAAVFSQLLEFLEANRAIAPSLVFEFTQASWRSMGPMEHESLAALSEHGYRFSLDNVTDLHFEPRDLANRGFRFVKIPGKLLLLRGAAASTDIHPADLSDLMARYGIDLIAERIESETSVVDLLDFDVRFGQGYLFSQPRPVRAEALQGIPDRADSSLEGVATDNSAQLPAVAPDDFDDTAADGRPGITPQRATNLADRA